MGLKQFLEVYMYVVKFGSRRKEISIAVLRLAPVAHPTKKPGIVINYTGRIGGFDHSAFSVGTDELSTHFVQRLAFLLAGLIPLGIALDQTGAAGFIAAGLVDLTGSWGPVEADDLLQRDGRVWRRI